MKGILGNMFDFNRDGKLDPFEQAAEFQFFHDVIMGECDACEDDETNDADEE